MAGKTEWEVRAEAELRVARAVLIQYEESLGEESQAHIAALAAVEATYGALRSARQSCAVARLEYARAKGELAEAQSHAGVVLAAEAAHPPREVRHG